MVKKRKTNVDSQTHSHLIKIVISFFTVWIGIVAISYLGVSREDTQNTFQQMYMEEVEAMKQQKDRFLQLVKDQKFHKFTEQDLEFMMNSNDPLFLVLAGQVLRTRRESKKATKILEDLAFTDRNIDPKISALAHNELSQIYVENEDYQKVIQIAQHAIETNQSSDMLDVWYSLWAEQLVELQKEDEAYSIIKKCLNECKSKGVEPKLCLNYAGILEMMNGNIIEAQEYYLRSYKALLDEWHREDGSICTGNIVPLSFPSFIPETMEIYKGTVLDENLTGESPTIPCSEQEWPFYVNKKNARDYYVGSKFEKMRCYSSEEKRTVLHLINDVEISGSFQTIVKEYSDGHCDMFVSSLPFGASVALPIHNTNRTYEGYLSTPIKQLNNVLVLHPFDTTYFHLIVEGMSKLFLSLLHQDLSSIPDLKILASPSDIMLQLAERLGVSDRIVPYEGDFYRYKIKNLYLVEWRMLDLDKPEYHTDEYFVPPLPVVQTTHSQILSQIENTNRRNLVIFCHRKHNARTIANSKALYKTLEHVSNLFGLKFQLLGENEQESLEEQMNIANRAVVIMGVHGSGLANMIFCQKDTAVIELPVYPAMMSVYHRLASSFRFTYYTVPSVNISFFDKNPTKLPVEVIQDIEKTLYIALLGQGLSPIELVSQN